MKDFRIPVYVEEQHGLSRESENFRIGVPLPRGLVYDSARIAVCQSTGAAVPHQAAGVAFWPDRSIKWLLVDAILRLELHARIVIFVCPKESVAPDQRGVWPQLQIEQRDEKLVVNTGRARFEMAAKGHKLFTAVTVGTQRILSDSGSEIRIIGCDNKVCKADVEQLVVEEEGPFRVTVVSKGRFRKTKNMLPLRFTSRTVFVAGTASVRIDFKVWNPQPAVHAGGLWDLGDPGSCFFEDLSICFHPRDSANVLRWHAERSANEYEHSNGPWSIYQDSSGGEHWDSPNHIDKRSQLNVVFRGYRVICESDGKDILISEGLRANPVVTLTFGDAWIAAGMKDFWQNFPKALRWKNGMLSVGLFPAEAKGCFELQGGEQKRHTVFLDFGILPYSSRIAELQRPVNVWVDPDWIESSRAIAWFINEKNDSNKKVVKYVNQVIEGPNSFFAKREIIDEYGWRNFGDLYADHEAVKHVGSNPLISHYNNQYDFIYGALFHYLRTGDRRWFELGQDAALHTIDIDIYHTDKDKPGYNHGLFWHTDHYKDARTGTHRTYSRKNLMDKYYGGGPSNEHNYTSGLLLYYYLNGDPEAGAAVMELADWVIAMDDGSRTIFGLIDEGPTGAASSTVDIRYHKPGRGAGNSINALMDAYRISGKRRYLSKAEELIQRCIHPKDDIAALKLDDPEYRWSYLVFLQVLGNYLDLKCELGESDYYFFYARASLLHYSDWMLENEVPYKAVLHKVLIPTETWPAHDIRKCHVFHLAAHHGSETKRSAYRQKAEYFFEKCLGDLLSFDSAHLTRPLVILAVYGFVHVFFQKYHVAPQGHGLHGHDFGLPQDFLTQRDRLKEALGRKTHLLTRFLITLIASKICILRRLWK